jgi:DNA polymerase-3 subunit gamma/tau
MSLYLKYRPATLEDVRGNDDIVQTLEKMLTNIKTCPHSFLLYGPTGCGKTTIGRIISTRLGCQGSDFREVDSADFRGIDTIREIRRNSSFMPIQGACRVWIIDECHKMTNDAQNALLKILEDTPKHIYFILCTTDPQKLLPTIKGRCIQLQVKPLNDNQMKALLRSVVREENAVLSKEIYEQITQDSQGHARDALQILEKVLTAPEERQLEIAKQTAEQQSQVIELCRALLSNSGWKKIATILSGLKDQEPESIRRAVLGYCQAVLLKPEDNFLAGAILEEFLTPFYDSGAPQLTYACYSFYLKNKES